MALGAKNSNENVTWNKAMTPKMISRFAICINNAEYPASLEMHKV